MILDLFIGFLLSFGVALLAFFKRSLTRDGWISATILGTTIYAFGSFILWGVLIAFFISSSLLTKLHEKKDNGITHGRNAIQVMSNGLIATVFSVLYYFFQSDILMLAAIVSIASSNADTWASEIGALTKGQTVHILNFKPVTKGVSGAISILGTFASLLGAVFISAIFILLYALSKDVTLPVLFQYGLIVTLCGFFGCLMDSLLGGSIQAKYKGIHSGIVTEESTLPNDQVVLVSGFKCITNDTVNFLSGFIASLISLLFFI
jgi:uncharacterized protein (TIGR00297 family)